MRCCRGGAISKCAATWAMTRLRDESGWLSVSSSTPMSSRGCGRRPWWRSSSAICGGQRMQAVDCASLPERVAVVLLVCQRSDYGWDRVCEQRFGTHPAQVFFEWNTAVHVQDNEQSPAKRAFTKESCRISSTMPMSGYR